MSIRLRQDGPVATIVIEAPGTAGALRPRDVRDLDQALSDCHGLTSIRGVIVTGVGAAFSSGTDLTTLYDAQEPEADRLRRWYEDVEGQRALLEAMLRFPKPLIAAVGGPALGWGLALAVACDVVLASEEARFGLPEVRQGLVPGLAAALLTWRYGAGLAARLAQTGESLGPDAARAVGLVAEIVPSDLLWARAHALGRQMSAASPQAILLTRRLINEEVGEALLGQLALGAAASATGRFSEAAREGVAAFLEHREPSWRAG